MTRSSSLWIAGVAGPLVALLAAMLVFPSSRAVPLAMLLPALGALPLLLLSLRNSDELGVDEAQRLLRSQSPSDGVRSLDEARAVAARQLAALEETAASMHEMSASLRQIAQSVETLAASAEE